jgi:hypothetical protein
MKKLSVASLSGSSVIIGRGIMTKGKMQQLGRLIKYCTHLNISACDRLDDSALENFNKLMFINLWSTKITDKMKNMLR